MVSHIKITASIPVCGQELNKTVDQALITYPKEYYDADMGQELQTITKAIVTVETLVAFQDNIEVD
jgi:hypothetical protein